MDSQQQVSGVVHADYHVYWLIERDRVDPDPGPRPLNGLISSRAGAAELWTGTHTGNVALTVEVRSTSPSDVDLTGWDEIIEVDIESPHGALQVTSPFVFLEREFPTLTSHGAGWYRVRVHAAGRDSGETRDLQAVSEQHLIIAWPVTHPAGEIVYKQTDQYGEELRNVRKGSAG